MKDLREQLTDFNYAKTSLADDVCAVLRLDVRRQHARRQAWHRSAQLSRAESIAAVASATWIQRLRSSRSRSGRVPQEADDVLAEGRALRARLGLLHAERQRSPLQLHRRILCDDFAELMGGLHSLSGEAMVAFQAA